MHKVTRNIFSNWAALLLNLIISFFLAPFVVNQLGSVYYGIWVIMMQLTGYLYLLDFGVRESVIRYVSKHDAADELPQIEQVVNAALRIYGCISLICLILAAIAAYFFPYIFNIAPEAVSTARHVVVITGVNMAQFFLFNVYVGVLMGIQRFDIFNKISIISSVIRVVLIVYFLHQGYGILALAYIQLAVNLFTNILVFLRSQILVPAKIYLKITTASFKTTVTTLVNYSFFVLLNNICQKIIFYTDALVIGFFLPASAITYYAIAGNLIEYLRKFVNSMANVFNPLTSELDTKNQPEKIQDLLVIGTKVSLLLGTPICIVYFFLGQKFIELWMGPEFGAPAASVLTILAVTHLFSMPHYTISSILYGLSRHHTIAYVRVFEAVANLVLSLILIRHLGIVGVALGTAVPHLISVTLILPIVIARILKLSVITYILKSYSGPIGSSLLFACSCYFADLYFDVRSLITFFGLVFAMLPLYIIPAWFLSFSLKERQQYGGKVLFFIKAIWRKNSVLQ